MIKNLGMIMLMVFITNQAVMANNPLTTQTYFNKWAQKNKIVGAAITLNDRAYFYGYSNKELAKPVTEKTEFGIGSITKTRRFKYEVQF